MSEATTEELLTRVLERLDRLEARLDALRPATDLLNTAAAKAPVMIDAAGSTASWAWRQAEAQGIDPIASGQAAAEVAIEAGRPESIATLKRLLAKQATLNKALDVADKLEADGTLDALVEHGAEVAPQLAKLVKNPSYKRLVEQALGSTQAIDVAGEATNALVETRKGGFKPLGLFGQLGMMMDADVQKAIGFTLAIAKRFGQRI